MGIGTHSELILFRFSISFSLSLFLFVPGFCGNRSHDCWNDTIPVYVTQIYFKYHLMSRTDCLIIKVASIPQSTRMLFPFDKHGNFHHLHRIQAISKSLKLKLPTIQTNPMVTTQLPPCNQHIRMKRICSKREAATAAFNAWLSLPIIDVLVYLNFNQVNFKETSLSCRIIKNWKLKIENHNSKCLFTYNIPNQVTDTIQILITISRSDHSGIIWIIWNQIMVKLCLCSLRVPGQLWALLSRSIFQLIHKPENCISLSSILSGNLGTELPAFHRRCCRCTHSQMKIPVAKQQMAQPQLFSSLQCFANDCLFVRGNFWLKKLKWKI